MERFKALCQQHFAHTAMYLHSNMERFKACSIKILTSLKHIYIPIWRDLKGGTATVNFDTETNLHSNMERFKGNHLKKSYKNSSHLHSNMERFKDLI